MADLVKLFTDATSLTGELELVIDAALLPAFDTSTYSPTDVARDLGPLMGRSLRIRAELMGSLPKLNATRDRHMAKSSASLERAMDEHVLGITETLRLSPRGAALEQVASNELGASLQLAATANSIISDMTDAYRNMNEHLGVLDGEATLVPVDDVQPSWVTLGRGAIDWYLAEASSSR